MSGLPDDLADYLDDVSSRVGRYPYAPVSVFAAGDDVANVGPTRGWCNRRFGPR